MKRRIVAERLANHLFTTEEAVDTTLALMGDLIAAMPRARLEAGLAARVGQQAVDRVLEAASGMASARRSLIAAHEALAEAKDQVGLRRITLVGGGDKAGAGPRPGHRHAVKSA
jgi:pyridoxal/pyridoxine/pyridoxamine kinase